MTKTTLFRGALAALTLAAVTAGSVAPASADYYYRRGGGWSPGAAAAVGAIGGLALGAAIAGSRPAYAYPAPAPVYAAPPPRPVYMEPEPECYVRRQRVWVEGWGWEVRRVRVCDAY
ncbi:hypothetical protein [Alsobacter sp. R-9]